jgi:ubiquinone/menaquinone biosynthesis C-methylase UbiE
MSTYDVVAPTYDEYRTLSDDVVERIRVTILEASGPSSRPRLLDLGAGSGRIGRAFVAAGDDYVGVDLSLGMLRQFTQRADTNGHPPRVAQADGQGLPFADGAFDAVMLIQVFGGLRGWRRVLAEARRVLRSRGALVLGRSMMPEDGVDARMKERLAAILAEMGVAPHEKNAREDVHHWLDSTARGGASIVAAMWNADRTPRGFLDRHRTGARFSVLPEPVKEEALRTLRVWAVTTFGSLEAVSSERHVFELRVFTFPEEVDR